ncbi:MAG: hypothetical protein PHU75_02985, partial [Candidatus Nanopelagicales bacterium]|nr:hypothetical protein [Candidatus Nanopelagicales bacterium]
FIDPVWIYSSGLGILLWLTVGALPTMFRVRWIGATLAAIAIAVMAVSTFAHNARFYSDIPARFHAKVDAMTSQQALADGLVAAGADAVFGSYYDVIPVGYASGMRLRTLTNHYNRFPLTAQELAQRSITVAVDTTPTDPWGEEAVATVQQACTALPAARVGSYHLFACPPKALAFNR